MNVGNFLWAALLLTLAAPALAEPPKVAVSIAPVHALAAAVMADVAAPALIVDPRQSEHTFQLKPSDARALAAADLVIWVGPGVEPMFGRTIAALPISARVLTLTRLRGLELLPRRDGGDWEDAHTHAHAPGHGEPADPHIWLDPDNARRIVEAIRDALVGIDAPNAYLYTRNAARADTAIRELDRSLRAQLAPLKGRRYLVFHDGYQYFERHYGLSPAGAVALSPETPPGARHLSELRARIKGGSIACVFREPQFSPAIVETLVEGLDVRTGLLDYLGAGYTPGPALWFEMMRGLGRSFAACLG